MLEYRKLIQWIDSNKQVGKTFYFYKEGKKVWSSVGIQKWDGRFLLYVDEIFESDMAADHFSREELLYFTTAVEAINFAQSNTQVEIEQLAPCKGQKVFNPQNY